MRIKDDGNERRMRHQNGNDLCDFTTYGLKACMVNGSIGEKVYNDLTQGDFFSTYS